MIVLVDSSIWIDFFSKKSKSAPTLPLLIEERRVATCQPIRAEILSGQMTQMTRDTVVRAFDAMIAIDCNWAAPQVWDQIIQLAQEAHEKKCPLPGIVDRMLLLASRESGASLWTNDKKLKHLAEVLKIPIFSE